MNSKGFYLIYLAPIPFTIIATIGLWFSYEGESASHIIENNNCPNCVTTRCPNCKNGIKHALHRQVNMTEDQMEAAYV